MIRGELHQICRPVHRELSQPLLINRIFIEHFRPDDLIRGHGKSHILFFLHLCDRTFLDEDIVIDPVVPVEDRHKSGDLCPVGNVVWRIPGLIDSVYDHIGAAADRGESSQHQIMHDSDPLGRDPQGGF